MARKAAAVPARSPQPANERTPSPDALAIAATYRAFDPALDDAALAAIARRIDAARALAAAFTAKPDGLRNADDLVVRFAADERY